MGAPANTIVTANVHTMREDLEDVIYRIDPEETPFQANIGRGKAKSTLHEWSTDILAAADGTNAQLEGDDAAFVAENVPTRLQNATQISRKTVSVSDTDEAVDQAGIDDMEAYQLAKKGVELRRDIETILLQNQAASSSDPRKAGSMCAFTKTNVDKDAGGTNPTYTTFPNATRTDSGTTRVLTETIVKNVVQLCYKSGAKIKTIMLGPVNKQRFSGFTGIALNRVDNSGDTPITIVGTADVYLSDFGKLSIVPNLFQRERDGWFLDFDLISLLWLRPMNRKILGDTGDSSKSLLRCEYTLKVGTEKGNGLAADLQIT